jgi:hypothetical protein
MWAVNSALAACRGQILGFGPRRLAGSERIEANLPANQREEPIAEFGSLSKGLGPRVFHPSR